jgi:hypothetical protein
MGYGKTTAVREFLAAKGDPVLWRPYWPPRIRQPFLGQACWGNRQGDEGGGRQIEKVLASRPMRPRWPIPDHPGKSGL